MNDFQERLSEHDGRLFTVPLTAINTVRTLYEVVLFEHNSAPETKKVEHIIQVLRSLHWLPTCHRADFKTILLLCKTQNGLGTKCIFNLLFCYEPFRPLMSAGTGLLAACGVKTQETHAPPICNNSRGLFQLSVL